MTSRGWALRRLVSLKGAKVQPAMELMKFSGAIWHVLAAFGVALINVIDRAPRSSAKARRPQLQSILRALPEPVFLFDRQGRIIDVNQPAEQMAGQPRNSLIGLDASVFCPWAAKGEPTTARKAVVDRTLRGESIQQERQTLLSDAKPESMEVLVSGNPLCDDAGAVLGALIVIQDVTELSALQRQLANSERHFAVGQMTAGLAHDFGNVLNTISEAVKVLETTLQAPSDQSILRVINNSVRRGSELISNIRGYLRGRPESRARVDLRLLLEEVLELARPLLDAHSQVAIQRELGESCEVFANPPELRRAFLNLLLNALEAMPDGGKLTLSCRRSHDRVVVSMGDTGAGIPQETQKMIFSPYFTTKAKGTGLGLAGTRQVIQAQGGEIHFESPPGAGTTFYVSLPIAKFEEEQSPRAV